MEARWLEKVSSKKADFVLPDAKVPMVEIDNRGSGRETSACTDAVWKKFLGTCRGAASVEGWGSAAI
jgi:hypothetical protein